MKLDLTKFIATQVSHKENLERAIDLKKKLIEQYIDDLQISECVRGLCNHKQEQEINFKILEECEQIKVEPVEEFKVCLNGYLIYNILMDIKYFEFMIEEINDDVKIIIEATAPQ
jgi:hypothetical protein